MMDDFLRLNLFPSKASLLPYGARFGSFSGKGLGWFGALPSVDGISTEISSENGIGLNSVEYPLMAPTLSKKELKWLLDGKEPTDEMYNKAELWAKQRAESGKSPFIQQGELRVPAGLLDVYGD